MPTNAMDLRRSSLTWIVLYMMIRLKLHYGGTCFLSYSQLTFPCLKSIIETLEKGVVEI